MTWKHLPTLILMMFSWIASAQNETVTYGDLMLADPQEELASRHSLAVAGGYDVTNPYLNVYNLAVDYGYEWTSLVTVGLEGLVYSASRSRYNERLESELNIHGIEANHDRPQRAAYGWVAFQLLQGRVNLLGWQALPFRFQVRMGSGYLWLANDRRVDSATWGIGPQVYFNPHWGASLRFDQDLESFWSAGENIYRNRLALSLLRVF